MVCFPPTADRRRTLQNISISYNNSMSAIDQISIQFVKGVGPAKKKLFLNLGVESIGDLFYLFPRRYEDRRNLTSIKEVKLGEHQTVCGRVMGQNARKSWYTKKHVHEVVIGDKTGRLTCVWFNQPYLAHYFKPGRLVVLYGKAEIYKNCIQMISPEYEVLESRDDAQLSMNRIVPIYPLTRGMTQRYLRKIINMAFETYHDRLDDILPVPIRNKHRLLNIQHSIEALHFPENFKKQEDGYRRISFEEFFLFQLSVKKRRLQIVGRPGYQHSINHDLVKSFCSAFPFELTNAQRRVINEIAGDMRKDFPMLRLLQGDVGCGKTLVSLFGCIAAAMNGHQSAIMVPTEVLARQHFNKIKDFAETLDTRHKTQEKSQVTSHKSQEKTEDRRLKAEGQNIQDARCEMQYANIKPVLLVGSMKKSEREEVLEDIRSGKADIVIGTHALLTEAVRFKDLSFAVIDEQHKFGVRQRAFLAEKGNNPDVLVMTATPIPRTLSLTLFGDLDVSTIDEMPKNRGTIATHICEIDRADDVYDKVRLLLELGQQAFVVYPVVQESETLDLKAAEEMYRYFQKKVFKEFRVGLAHGQMKRKDLDTAMRKFKAHKIDLLVATTVLEVGVDIPNANVMVIEHAERFGLSQLHQLRGRIGRGEQNAQCFLLAEPTTEEGLKRLEAICSTNDGFILAEKDLEIRGPGHYFGRHQHGMNELRFTNPMRQMDILEAARDEAEELIHADPELQSEEHQVLVRTIRQRYPGYLEHIEAG